MRDPISAILTSALDDAGHFAPADQDGLATALEASAERRESLAKAGVRVDESPYLHFLRRFAGETAPPALAASA